MRPTIILMQRDDGAGLLWRYTVRFGIGPTILDAAGFKTAAEAAADAERRATRWMTQGVK